MPIGASKIAYQGYQPAAGTGATGGTETTYGSYKVHTFTTSGTFTVNSALSDVDVLVVGGGGAGGIIGWGGGGGASGLLEGQFSSLGAGSYTITVGAGGVKGTDGVTGEDGGSGSNTTFGSLLTATGGGGGGGRRSLSVPGVDGGCGGGANANRDGAGNNLGGSATQSNYSPTGWNSRTRVAVTANGDAKVDTAQSKFGGSSAFFDGTGDGLTTGQVAFSGSAWTFECWYYNNNTFAPADVDIIFDPRINTGNGYTNLIFGVTNGFIGVYTNSWKNASTQMTSGQWNHLAWSWDGSTIRMFVNGTQYHSTADTRTYYDCGLAIGSRYDVGAFYTNGWIDDARISNVARYTSNFTAPTAAHINDSNTVLLLNMNGEDETATFADACGYFGQDGGDGSPNTNGGGGGGGGAIQVGEPGLVDGSTNYVGGNGGYGKRNPFRTGSDVVYADGGGGAGGTSNYGGIGGTGTGGNGYFATTTKPNGDANSGSGGGGDRGNGGSGIVVIRYVA